MVRLLFYIVEWLFLLLGWQLLGRLVRSLMSGSRTDPSSFGRRNSGARPAAATVHGKMARDPMCGMFVSTEVSHRLRRDGKTLHFCSAECLERYSRKESETTSPESEVRSQKSESRS